MHEHHEQGIPAVSCMRTTGKEFPYTSMHLEQGIPVNGHRTCAIISTHSIATSVYALRARNSTHEHHEQGIPAVSCMSTTSKEFPYTSVHLEQGIPVNGHHEHRTCAITHTHTRARVHTALLPASTHYEQGIPAITRMSTTNKEFQKSHA